MAKSRSDGVRGLPKLPTALKVLFELYCTLDVWSPYCLFSHTVVNRQYVMNLRQKARWLKVFVDKLEQGADELLSGAYDNGDQTLEQHDLGELDGRRELPGREWTPDTGVPQTTSDEVEEGRVDAPQEAQTSFAAYEKEGS